MASPTSGTPGASLLPRWRVPLAAMPRPASTIMVPSATAAPAPHPRRGGVGAAVMGVTGEADHRGAHAHTRSLRLGDARSPRRSRGS